MAVSNFILRSCWPILTLLWICVSGNSFDFLDQEEDEIFHSDKQSTLSWTSEPDREWGEVKMGNKRPGPVLQACGRRVQRTVLSRWMERKDAHFLLMDVSFTQEEETSGQLSPLQVHLFDSDTPFPRFKYGRSVLDLQTSRPFPVTIKPQAVLTHLNLSRALDLGPVSHRGFQIGFSYSGTCVLLTSIRLYYRKCSDITAHLVKFKGTGAGSGPAMGSCVKGAVEVSPPVRECSVGGVWGPLQGGCTCEHGHHVISHTCEACEQGFYKPANDSGRCRLCPPNSRTHTEGSGMCVCVEGFSRLTSDSTDIGCTRKVPHADVTVTTSFVTLLISPSPQKKAYFSSWLVVGVLFFILLLTAMIPIAVCVLRHRRTKFRSDQEVLFSMSSGISYRRPEVVEAAPPATDTVGGGVELLVFGDRLKDFLVDRNKLTLGKELGRGEFGSVYEGVFSPSEGVNMKVAVKTMRVGLHSQADLHDFLKEAELMQNFRHENVVRLLGVTVQREQDCPLPVPLVILPYMKHGDLRRFLIATRYGDVPMFVPVQSLLRFMVDIAAGMEYLSSQGFLHRDLAARNCMLGDDLHVCVADFGLSKRIYSSNYYRQRAAVRVPIKWMSMESLSESVYSIKSDVWSFGVTMWEILSRGRTPYPGVNNHELLDLLRSGFRMKPPEECDNRLYEVMRSCWDEDPILRPAFGALVQTLKGFLSELPELDVSEEANYINQGLQAAAAAPPHTDGRGKNIYLCAPVGAAAREEEVELEDGYLKYIRENDNK
ncbi:tyrosine-protein kinase Mer-like isoform X2 [Notolabrus celidotus]|uniref:tyrosine-protein kinase Mer-like isoform X2 n=1 Tax=Notolabrus celidotus TaxID=1203425 RepID=UPI0014904E78|nr:tyrosine-protein kinase Mer-like isoform X2 [Notolabrus celidotus]